MQTSNRSFRVLSWSLMLAMAVLLSACGGKDPKADDLTPTPETESAMTVVVDGQVVPLRRAALALEVSGVVEEVLVSEGQRVARGEPLARLANRQAMQAEIDAARLEQIAAQQAYTDLLDNAPAVTAQAQLNLANARDALKDADYKWRVQQEGYRASTDTIRLSQANLALAEEAVEDAEDGYHTVSGRDTDDEERAMALANLVAAKKRRDDLKRSFNWYTGKPSEIDQAILDGELAQAQADLRSAEIEWEKVKEGVDAEDLALAQARLAQAVSQLAAAEDALSQMELRAPFDGIVLSITLKAGEYATAGMPVAWVADDSGWNVETTDLSEVDVVRVQPGSPASISLDAMPEVEMDGVVESVRGYGESRQGDITYTAVIRLIDPDPRLRWNMTAFVTIEPAP
jgi:HlyD family secretion protein